jgi:hypothetical protein
MDSINNILNMEAVPLSETSASLYGVTIQGTTP